jgi:GNAT superfamily N-acetyltransferase
MDSVRPAHPRDRSAVTAAVAAAFARDPAWNFLFGDDYDRLAPLFAGALFDLRVGSGDVWVTEDVSAASFWEPPGRQREPAPVPVWDAYRAAVGEKVWQRLADYEGAVDTARPTTPYWYLGVLATRPDRQRQGLASAVMAPILARADSDGIECCLETSTESNRAFYERRGFTVVTAVHITAGPPTWWLRRLPQGSSA